MKDTMDSINDHLDEIKDLLEEINSQDEKERKIVLILQCIAIVGFSITIVGLLFIN